MIKFSKSKLPGALIKMGALFEILALEIEIYLLFEVCYLEINKDSGKKDDY